MPERQLIRERSEVIFSLRKGAVGPAMRTFISGSRRALSAVQGSVQKLAVGETFVVKSGEAHTFHNTSQTEVFESFGSCEDGLSPKGRSKKLRRPRSKSRDRVTLMGRIQREGRVP